jgi:tetratricopeptide (TPR) repeat protein
MRSVSTLAAAFSLLVTTAMAQTDLVREFGDKVSPSFNLLSREPIYFRWNFAGPDQAAMNEGLNEMAEDHFGVALTNFESVIQHQPSFYAAYYYRGLCNKFLKKFKEAEKDFRRAVHLNDTLSAGYIELGKMRIIDRDPEKARSFFERASKIPPYSPGLIALGDLEFIQKKYSNADSLYARSIHIDPRASDAYSRQGLLTLTQNHDKPAALIKFSKALAIDSLQLEALFWRGITRASLGNFKESLADWNSLVRSQPSQPLFILLRATIQIQLDQTDLAFSDLRKFAQMAEVSETEFAGMQSDLDKRIDIQNALQYTVRKMYGLEDKSVEAIKAGFCDLLMGKYNAALDAFLSIKEETGLSHYLVALAFEHLGNHKAAFKSYEMALAADDDIPDAHKKHGIYLMELKRFPEAEMDFTQMIQLQSERVVAYKFRGLARAHQGKCADAIDDIGKFINVDSTDREAFKTRGFCRERLNDFRGACDDYWIAFTMDTSDREMILVVVDKYAILTRDNPNDGDMAFRFGQALVASGQLIRGLEEVKRASKKGSVQAKEFIKMAQKSMQRQQ